MTSLTHAQRHTLKDLLDPDDYARTCGPTNATMAALRKRGLVDRITAPVDTTSPYRFHWIITDLGRAAIGVALTPQDAKGGA